MNKPNDFLQESHSKLFISLTNIINTIHDGEKYTLNQCLSAMNDTDPNNEGRLLSLLDSVLFFMTNEGDPVDIISLFENKQLTTRIKRESYAHLKIDLPVPIIPTAAELPFLKYMLTDETAKFLLPTNIREKLLSLMEHVQVPNLKEHYEIIRPANSDISDEKLRSVLHDFWLALCKGKVIYWESMADNGILYKGEVFPIRIGYDAALNLYSLIVWNEEENQAIKISANNVQKITLLDDIVPADLKKLFHGYLKQHRCTFTLKIEKKNNAVERCFTLFASYDKEATYDEATETYTMKIDYYDFDYNIVLEDVLSLGSAATVIMPDKMRSDIITKIQTAQNLYAR